MALGDDAFHVEFVRDAVPGALASCVSDDEIEEFVRGGSPGFTVMGTPGVEERALKYRPVADSSTGETLASTSLYKASRPWIKTAAEFDTVIKLISVHGQVFADVVVHFSTDDRKN